jgi:acetolactate synthase-1/3 small subunit
MTVVVDADDNTLEQVRKQLAKLVPVVKVRDFAGTKYIERDLCMITVGVTAANRGEVIEIVNLFRGKVVDLARNSLIVEISGPVEKVEAMVELLEPYGIKEMARTGVIAMARGTQAAKDEAAEKNPTAATGGKRKRSLTAPSAAALPPS